MISRKEFLRDLLRSAVRAINDLDGGCECAASKQDEPGFGFELSAAELCPALLATEAERRGVRLEGGDAEELRREIYHELAPKSSNST